MKRAERIAAITRMFIKNPGKVFNINDFCNLLDCAKSSISEDIDKIQETFRILNYGSIITTPGANGGIRYIPYADVEFYDKFVKDLCKKLSNSDRIVSGDFIYTSDLLYTPDTVNFISEILAFSFLKINADYVVTIETKGIPLAFAVAQQLNIPLVIIRQEHKITDGPVVSINFMSGSTRNIKTMYLSKRAVKNNSKVIIIDDFMKAGGTAKGIVDMMKEFNSQVVGIGVMIATKQPVEKLVNNYVSIIQLNNVDGRKSIIDLQPGEWRKNFSKIEDF